MTEEIMQKLGLIVATVHLVLIAACSPADSVPVAFAEVQAAAAPLHPDVASGAAHGHVHEYH